jgi:hypothetical protein
MGNALNNHRPIVGSQQQPDARREQVMKQIGQALVTNTSVGIDARQRGGFDPYDSQLGANQRDVWGKRRRA